MPVQYIERTGPEIYRYEINIDLHGDEWIPMDIYISVGIFFNFKHILY